MSFPWFPIEELTISKYKDVTTLVISAEYGSEDNSHVDGFVAVCNENVQTSEHSKLYGHVVICDVLRVLLPAEQYTTNTRILTKSNDSWYNHLMFLCNKSISQLHYYKK